MSEYERDREKHRQEFRDTHPPSSPRRRRRPVNDENEPPSRIPLDEQERRLAVRQASRNNDVQGSPRRRRHTVKPSTIQHPLHAASSEDPFLPDPSIFTTLPTPPATQTPVEESGLTRRQISQRRRRLREKEEAARKQQEASSSSTIPTESNVHMSLRRIDLRHPPTTSRRPARSSTLQIGRQAPPTPPLTQTQSNHSAGQIRRQQREQEDRQRMVLAMMQPGIRGEGAPEDQPRHRQQEIEQEETEEEVRERQQQDMEVRERGHQEQAREQRMREETDQEIGNQRQETEQLGNEHGSGEANLESRNGRRAHIYINPFLQTRGDFCAARRPYADGVRKHDIGHMDKECQSCGALHWPQERTAGSLSNPQFGMCCAKGKVRLPDHPPPPPLLRYLAESQSRAATEFRENIAQYNCALAFTSVAVDVDERVNHVGRGKPVGF